jgi:hypothetical protein
MNTNYTHIVVLLDSSGSMSLTASATIEGINLFMERQKFLPSADRNLSFDPDLGDTNQVKCTATLIKFSTPNTYRSLFSNNGEPQSPLDDIIVKIYENKDINEITPLNNTNYQPYGGTPLIDAFCKTIVDTSSFVNKLPENERPGRMIFVVMTDGEDLNSTIFTKEQLAEKIAEKQALNWQFIYLGANHDAFTVSKDYGVQGGQTAVFQPTYSGIMDSLDTAADTVLMKRIVTSCAEMTNCSITDISSGAYSSALYDKLVNSSATGQTISADTLNAYKAVQQSKTNTIKTTPPPAQALAYEV